MDEEEESSTSGFGIPLPPKSQQPRLTTYTKCVIYQANRDESLRSRDVFWHSTCYSSYTSQQNIRYATGYDADALSKSGGDSRATNEETRRISRSCAGFSMDWSKCFICRNKTYKKCREMHNVCTFEACALVRQAAENKGDKDMLHTFISVNNDLIAAEAKYHKNCLASYVSKSNLKHKGFKEKDGETIYDSAFKEIAGEISEGLNQGKAYDMSSLLLKYRQHLSEKGIESKSYSKQRMKLQLEKYFGKKIVFHQHPDRSKAEVIYSSDISVQDVLNAAAAQNAGMRSESNISDISQDIINIALRIKEDIRKCSGISLRPLNVDDISLDTASKIIPPGLYWLLRLMITFNEAGVDDFEQTNLHVKIEDERRILSIAQDIIHCTSNTPEEAPEANRSCNDGTSPHRM
eukprot:gene4498-5096_t